MKKFTLLALLSVIYSFSVIGKVWTITASNTARVFTPANITITQGDSVFFSLGNSHDAVEVSQATYNANGSTPLPGGFALPFGGGLVVPSQLGIGAHYYVCTPHADVGMKGIINVLTNGVAQISSLEGFKLFPNPCTEKMNIQYHLELRGQTQVRIYNQMGQLVTTLSDEFQLPGDYSRNFNIDRSRIITGLYYVEFTSANRRWVQKLLIK